MPLPYPDDVFIRIRQIELQLQQLMSLVTNRPAFNKVEGGSLQIGADDGPRIIIGIGEDDLPALDFYPGTGDSHARIVAGSDSGDTGIGMVGEADASGRRFEVVHQQDLYQILHTDDDGEQADGALLELADDYAIEGYLGSQQQFQNYWYHDFERTTLVGSFIDGGAGPYWGILCGSEDVSSGSQFASFSYGTTMATKMNPIISIRDGGQTANFDWCLTRSDPTGFTVDWANTATSSKEIYYWSFRT